MRKYTLGILSLIWGLSHIPAAIAANSNWIGPGSDFNTAGNWSAGVPNFTDNGSFNAATPTDISFSADRNVQTLTFNPSAAAYTFTIPSAVTFIFQTGGIINSSSNRPTFVVNSGGTLGFIDTGTTAADAVIVNHGLLRIEGDNATAGHATITNTGTMRFSGSCFFGCVSGNASNATIINAGVLSFDTIASGSNATLINTSSLLVKDSATLGNATLMNEGSVDATQVTVSTWAVGSLSGSGSVDLGSHTLIVGSNNLSTTVSGNISGTRGSLTKVGNGTLTLAGSNSYTGATTINAGTLDLLSSLSSDVTVGAAGNLSGTGTLRNLTNTGTVTPGRSGVGTLTAATYSGTGTLHTVFDGTSHGLLNILGNANMTGGTLQISGSHFAVGQYTVLHAGSLTGIFSTVSSSSTLLVFAPDYTTTDAFVRIHFATPFLPLAQNTNQRQLAAHLDEQKLTSTVNFTDAITTLEQLPAAQFSSAYTQLSGDSLASFQNIGLQDAAAFTKGLHQRVVNLSSGTSGLWAQGLGSMNTVKGDTTLGSPAFQTTTGGFQAGYDELWADHVFVGFSGGYAQTNLDVTDRANSGTTRSIHSGVYAGYAQEVWFANAALGYTAEANKMTRPIQLGTLQEAPHANFDSRLYTTFVETGYTGIQPRHLSLEPFFSLRQTHLAQDGFTESGAPGVGLTVADRSLNSWVSSLGVGLGHQFLPDASYPLKTNVNVAWEHEWADIHNSLSAHFAGNSGGSDFTVEGTPRSRNAAVIELEGRVPLRVNLELSVSYTAALAAAETHQRFLGGIRFTW